METRVCRLYAKGDLRVETDEIAGPGPGEVLVRIGAGGICGSDLHYFQDGGFGPIRVREPIILGHEAAGIVEAVGEGVTAVKPGDPIAVNPSRPCGTCRFCQAGQQQHCLTMRFRGSAMRQPHEQGLFRDLIVVDEAQCVPVGPGVTIGEAACCEPLSVALHAVRRAGAIAGSLAGRRVLVTGSGPIGSLCIAAARHAGALEIVATDPHAAALETAAAMGATRTVNVPKQTLAEYEADKGWFDVAFDCSAAPSAIHAALATLRPGGTLVQVGVTGDLPIPINMIVGKEINFVGTHRFHEEFAVAARLISERRIDVRPLISDSVPVEDALGAFALAGDRSRAMKVQLTFERKTNK
ncbi:L-idonate 5-dehydrogenase [Tistlia consotensis]|nr:L-idonate 5-dehydrogenase [Tistlia consotensis]